MYRCWGFGPQLSWTTANRWPGTSSKCQQVDALDFVGSRGSHTGAAVIRALSYITSHDSIREKGVGGNSNQRTRPLHSTGAFASRHSDGVSQRIIEAAGQARSLRVALVVILVLFCFCLSL